MPDSETCQQTRPHPPHRHKFLEAGSARTLCQTAKPINKLAPTPLPKTTLTPPAQIPRSGERPHSLPQNEKSH
ncbi:hypothetical protein [Kamptonema formosum]|uniref:hypothetical protein n=1 Tax=Kamptonema formosum TaxID=331992 RepID=UPI000347B667|nr:hypothetical protein [Oscillatoria sp. PCC 10802]